MLVARRQLRDVSLTIICTLIIVICGASGVGADTTYVPSPDNGQKVYLSISCHDRGTGSCQTNIGCDGFDENVRSEKVANAAAKGDASGVNLLGRQYKVRIGDGLTSQNVNRSNDWNAKMHIPLHSNAKNNQCDSPVSSDAYGGTHPLYVSSNGRQLARQLLLTMDSASPGTNDQVIQRNDLTELNDTNAVAGYLEAEFHTWNKGVNFMRDSAEWAWLIGYAVDRCRGYPRAGQGTTSEKYCDW